MIDAIVVVIAAGVMPDPYSAVINVRRIGMVGLIAVVAALVALIAVVVVSLILGFLMIVAVIGRWTMRRRRMLSAILTAVAMVVSTLGKCRHSHNQ
jgi:hypothetical protein